VRYAIWADFVPDGYYGPPPPSTHWLEVRDMECRLFGRVKIVTSDWPWHARHYWRFVLRSDIEISYPPKETQFEVRTVDLPVAEFRIGGRSDRWYGFQTDKSMEELKRIPSFTSSGGAEQ
jgi:hypothetical protein